MNKLIRNLIHGGLGGLVVFATSANAAPGMISNTPLIVSSVVDPNFMLLLDSSGSMSNIVPDSPYDPTASDINCPAGQAVSTADQVDVKVESDGDVYFNHNSTDYDWGIKIGNGQTGNPTRCFDTTATYTARLFANDGSLGGTKSTDGYLPAEYKGHYLNWYFANAALTASDNFGLDGRQKIGTNTRMEVAQDAAVTLVDSIDNTRLGLATYDGSSGARIVEGLADIQSNKSAVISAINNISNSGSTPLAESFEEIGRYFVQGYEGQTIVLHPGQANQTSATASSVFSHTPSYANSLHTPTAANPAIQYFCQQNFLVALTDGRPQSDQDVDSDLTDYDGDCASASPACLAYDQKQGRTYESNGSDYLDDVALALNEIDLRPDLDDFDNNEVVNNITTYMIGFADDQVANDPLMQDTADNGGGKFITAKDADSLVKAFTDATAEIFAKVGSASSVAFNSTTLGTDSAVFFARFNTNRWNGELFSFPLSATGSVGSAAWEAGDELDGIGPTSRTIFTYDGSDGIVFDWASLTSGQQADLNIDKNGNTDANGSARLDFIRGDRSNEGKGLGFRIRNSRLGDIVTSTPVFVGKEPGLNYPDIAPFGVVGNRYSDYVAKLKTTPRRELVYVGANDGMVHGFDASSTAVGGDEVMAYIPGALYSTAATEGLHYLASEDYTHRFYVDSSPVASDVFISTGATQDWRTILVGGLGAGGKGIYALDVTNPAKYSESPANAADVVLWEFTSADDPDLGYTFSRPVVAMMNNGKWAAIFGNGYNNDGDGKAKLFIVFIEDGVDGSWDAGDVVEIDTGVGTALDKNGLSSIAVADIDGNKTLDYVYAGDVKGNLWAFDLSAKSSGSWAVSYKSGSTPVPLFKATDASGNPQPITSAPVLSINQEQPFSGNEPNILVSFGTGQYLTSSDTSSTDDQTFYTVWDSGSSALTRSNLEARTLTEKAQGGLVIREVAGNPIDWTKQDGWYLDFTVPNNDGERVVSNSLIRGGVLFFNTLIPDTTPCAFGGSGFLMSLDPQTGLAPSFAVFDGNNDGDIDKLDIGIVGQKVQGLPARSGILGDKQYTPTSEGTLHTRDIRTGGNTRVGRLAWQELTPDQ